MRKLSFYLLATFFFYSSTILSQILTPEFEKVRKVDSLNSEAEESMPLPYLFGKKMYFVRTYIGGSMKERSKGQEIWSSERVGNTWSTPVSLFDEANDNGNNAVIGTSYDGNKVYVFNSIQTTRRLAKGVASTTKDENGEWSDLKKEEIPGFRIGEGVYSFYMNSAENILLIGAPNDSANSHIDLHVSVKQEDGSWGEMKSLGNKINTVGNEISPYLFKDTKTLYFASDGHEGRGGTDIFVSYRLDDSWENWTTPMNLGRPINSKDFDAYFIIGNNEEVFFTSNRDGDLSEIYHTKISRSPYQNMKDIIVEGEFIYKGLPADRITLEVFDQNGNKIDELVTDAHGRFRYIKISPDENYIVKVAEEDKDAEASGIVYLLDDKGKKMKRLVMTDDGSLVPEEAITDKVDIQGIFTYNQLPLKSTGLVLIDENGFPVDTIYTDELGQFQYSKLAMEKNFKLSPLNVKDDENVSGIVYLLNETTDKKMARLVMDKEGNFVDEDMIADRVKLQGVFNYKELPMKNAGLVILDENGFPLDTVYTDEEGKFEYLKMALDKNFTIVPLQVEDAYLENIDLYLTNDAGEKIQDVSPTKDMAFNFGPKYNPEELAQAKKPKKKEPKRTKKEKPKKKATPATTPGVKSSGMTIYFNFNEYVLTDDDKVILDKAIEKLKANSNQRITLEGHTDWVGSAKNNMKVAKFRANAAKVYLEEKGINASRILIDPKGEDYPVANNKTAEGRAKNRRVEVLLK